MATLDIYVQTFAVFLTALLINISVNAARKPPERARSKTNFYCGGGVGDGSGDVGDGGWWRWW